MSLQLKSLLFLLLLFFSSRFWWGSADWYQWCPLLTFLVLPDLLSILSFLNLDICTTHKSCPFSPFPYVVIYKKSWKLLNKSKPLIYQYVSLLMCRVHGYRAMVSVAFPKVFAALITLKPYYLSWWKVLIWKKFTVSLTLVSCTQQEWSSKTSTNKNYASSPFLEILSEKQRSEVDVCCYTNKILVTPVKAAKKKQLNSCLGIKVAKFYI